MNAKGEYEPIDPDGKYTLASINYLIKDFGAGGILKDAKPIQLDVGLDIDILERYIMATLNGVIPADYAYTTGRINVKN